MFTEDGNKYLVKKNIDKKPLTLTKGSVLVKTKHFGRWRIGLHGVESRPV